MDNIVNLKDYDVSEDIKDFIDGLEAERTKVTYKSNIDKFVKWKWDTSAEFVGIEDVNKLNYTDFKKFRDAMRRKYSLGTVNNIMTSVYALLTELKKVQDESGYVYDIEDIERLRVKQFKNKNVDSAGYLMWEETDEWIKFLEDSDEPNAHKKAAYIKLARQTGLRASSMAELKYSDIRKEDNIYSVHSFLKNKKHKIAIPEKLAEEILSLKRLGDTRDSKIFFSSKTAERLINMLKKEFNIEPERNISLHSLRNLTAWEIYCKSKDILSVQTVLNHESIETTYGYIHKRESSEFSPTLFIGKEIGKDSVKDLNKNQWDEIFDQLPRSVQYEILNKAKELGYSQK